MTSVLRRRLAVVLLVLSILCDTAVPGCPKGCKCSKKAEECELLVECRKIKAFPMEYPVGADCVFLQNKQLGELQEDEKKAGMAALPATLKRVDFSESRLGIIGAGWFEHLTELRILNLEFNKLTAVPADAFRGLTQLKVLWLTGNHYQPDEPEYKKMKAAGNAIVDIDKDAFVGLSNLQVLLMHHNKVPARALDKDMFRDLGKLKVLKLLDNPCTTGLKKSNEVFNPIRENCYQLDIKRDSGDDLEDFWERTRTYFSDDWFKGPPKKKNNKREL